VGATVGLGLAICVARASACRLDRHRRLGLFQVAFPERRSIRLAHHPARRGGSSRTVGS
jgi:hypothetical protein